MPLLKAQDCFDHDPIEKWQPNAPTDVDYWLCLHIGPTESEGADLFYVNVLTESAADQLAPEELASRKKIILSEYSWSAVLSAVNKIIQSAEGPDWSAIASKLCQSFDWEFDNYRP